MSFIDDLKKNINITKAALKFFVSNTISLKKDKNYVDPIIPIEPITETVDMSEIDKIIDEIVSDDGMGNGDSSVDENIESSIDDWIDLGDAKINEPELEEEENVDFKEDQPEIGFFSGTPKKPNVPPVVFELDRDLSPDFQAAVSTPQPIDAGPSILDTPVPELESMDIGVLRSVLLNEVQALELATDEYRKVQLQKIFSKLIGFQPYEHMWIGDDRFANQEQRFYADLISIPELHEIPYVRDFLENDFYVSSYQDIEKKTLLLKVYRYYDTHDKESIDKFNYVFRSSDYLSNALLREDIELEDFFSERIMHSFRKEDLSQMFRFAFYSSYMKGNLHNLFSQENSKALFMISQMTMVVNESIGHSSEFFESALDMFSQNNGKNNFVSVLESFYDEFISSPEDERSFAEVLANNPDFPVIKELINYVVLKGYDHSVATSLFDKATTFEEFMNAANAYRKESHRDIVGHDGIDKILAGTFNPETDFKPISDSYGLETFKEALLYNLYGISMEEAKHLKQHYGKYMEVLSRGIPPKPEGMSDEEFLATLDESQMTIMKKDYATLQMFKAIDSIASLSGKDPQYAEKLEVLRKAYLKHVTEKGFERSMPTASAIIVEGLLNNMYMNSYNKRLLNVSENLPVVRVDKGVTLLDAGVEFDMMLTSLTGVGNLFDSQVNMASKWNTAAMGTGQGICTSHISSQNLGVISLDSPMLGFGSLPGVALNAMGTTDIFTSISTYNLRSGNDSRQGQNRFFVPGNIMSNETRYGYNEILVDRFLMQDETGQLKLQPSYMVFFKMTDEDYKMNQVYFQTLKMAQDFGIPIMVVDIPKIKEHERSTIKGMEEDLFSRDEVDAKLVEDIVTRYMNNYTGSLTITANYSCGWKHTEDFSIDGVKQFFSKAVEKIGSIEDPDLQRQWLDALEAAYKLEKKRYKEARSVGGWKDSVSKFLLQDIGIKSQLEAVRYDLDHGMSIGTSPLDDTIKDLDATSGSIDDPWKTEELTFEQKTPPDECPTITLLDGTHGTFVMDSKYTPEIVSIMRLANYMEVGTTFEVVDNYSYDDVSGKVVVTNAATDDDIVFAENLIASYLFENTEVPPIALLEDTVLKNGIDTSLQEGYDWNTNILNSPYRELFDKNGNEYTPLPVEKISVLVSKVESMKDEDFVKIFTPFINSVADKTGEARENIAERLLAKKTNIANVFAKLQTDVKALNGEEDVITTGDDSKHRG